MNDFERSDLAERDSDRGAEQAERNWLLDLGHQMPRPGHCTVNGELDGWHANDVTDALARFANQAETIFELCQHAGKGTLNQLASNWLLANEAMEHLDMFRDRLDEALGARMEADELTLPGVGYVTRARHQDARWAVWVVPFQRDRTLLEESA